MIKFVLVVVLLFSVAINPLMAQSKNEQSVATAVERLRKAMVDANKTELGNLIAEQLSYGHSGGHVEHKNEFIAAIVSGQSDFVSITLTEQTISLSKNIAIVRHNLTAITNNDNKPGEVHLLVLLVWQKQDGLWKLLARQAAKKL